MFIKRPRKDRKSYAIVGNQGKTIKDERIDKVNLDLKAGVAQDILESRMAKIIEELQGKARIVLSLDNRRLARDCHADKMKEKGHILRAPEDAERRLYRAAEVIGTLSLSVCTKEELINALAGIKKPGSRYKIIGGLNELLAFAKRDFTLWNPVPEAPDEIRHIRIERFMALINKVPPLYAIYIGSLFATGCRFGELPRADIDEEAGKTGIFRQLKETGKEGPPKSKSRVAPIIPPLMPFVQQLLELGRPRVDELRLHHHKKINATAWETLGVKCHDLRHSYAIAWAQKGATTAQIADYIGDTPEVCARHYTRYLKTDEEIQKALRLWGTK